MSNKIIEKIKRLFRKQEEDTSIIFKLKPEEISKPMINIKDSDEGEVLFSLTEQEITEFQEWQKQKGGNNVNR